MFEYPPLDSSAMAKVPVLIRSLLSLTVRVVHLSVWVVLWFPPTVNKHLGRCKSLTLDLRCECGRLSYMSRLWRTPHPGAVVTGQISM